MKRFQGNPILKPISNHVWEERAVFNAAAIHIGEGVHILYRAVCNDDISRLGYAFSLDGYHIEERLTYPVFEPANYADKDGCEDPRLTLIGDQCMMAYTALRDRSSCAHQVGLTSIETKRFVNKQWNWGERRMPFEGIRNKDAVILPRKVKGRYVMFHRINPDICIAYSDDLKSWYDLKATVEPRPKMWDSMKVGAAGPPIEISEGWLFIYHGVDFECVYRLGVLLLEKDDPEKVMYRSEKPILEPIADYERYGRVPNVVFSCGAVLMDDRLLIYYGGADTVVCVATYDLNELIL